MIAYESPAVKHHRRVWWWHCIRCGDTMQQRDDFGSAEYDQTEHIKVCCGGRYPVALRSYTETSISTTTFEVYD